MKTLSNSRVRGCFWRLALALLLLFSAAPALRAGLAMEMDLVLGNDTYYYFPNLGTNTAAPSVPLGNYFVTSPGWPTNGASALYNYSASGFTQVGGSTSYGFSDFDSPDVNDSFIQNITNGQWSIFVTNSAVTNVYYFTVTASITSNSILPVAILYPPNGALNVTNQPTFIWEGPTNYGDLILYDGPNNASLPVTQTNYNGFTLPDGLVNFTVHYDLYSTTAVVSSVPTNSAAQPLSSWVSTAHLQDYATSQFTVSNTVANFNADLSTTNLPWATMGDAAWFTETNYTYNGAPAAAQSGSVTGSQSSTLSVTVNGPGTLTFYWSSIANDTNEGFDYTFEIDGNYEDDIYGDTSWYQEVCPTNGSPYTIPSGLHVLSWVVTAGGDTDPTQGGYLQDVSYVTAGVPTLTVTASPTNGSAPLVVQFTSTNVDSLGNTVTNWNWTFGDGGGSPVQSPMHTYTNSGSYSPALTAYSTYGATPLTVIGPGTVTVTNVTLNVSETPPYGVAPLTVQFASPGTDSDGNTVTNWNWTFGDGGMSTAQNPTHVYPGTGSFTPGLTAYSTHASLPLAVSGLSTINIYSNPTPAFRVLYTFSTNFGSGPNSDLALAGNTLYGTTQHGGSSTVGTVFAIATNGMGFTNLYGNFSTGNGEIPVGGAIVSGGALYGVTYLYGSQGGGTVFAMGTNGLGYTNLLDLIFSVNGVTGEEPLAPLALAGNTLYGTTWYGGSSDQGTVYYVSTNGAASGELHDFSTPTYNGAGYAINYDGIFPSGRLLGVAGALYGTTEQGGNNGVGTVFSVITNTPFTFGILHYFSTPVNGTNGDGAYSFSGLVLSGTNLYGTALNGGAYGSGTVFCVSTNGLFFTNLYSFTGGNDGSEPKAGLALWGKTLFGSTIAGGTSSNGVLFAINTDGSGFTNLYNFTGGGDGASPQTDLILSGNVLYGTAASGGQAGVGTVFSYTLPRPQLVIARAGANVILTWSAAIPGYTLESATNIVPSSIWVTNSTTPADISGFNTVTNAIGGSQSYYRLIH